MAKRKREEDISLSGNTNVTADDPLDANEIQKKTKSNEHTSRMEALMHWSSWRTLTTQPLEEDKLNVWCIELFTGLQRAYGGQDDFASNYMRSYFHYVRTTKVEAKQIINQPVGQVLKFITTSLDRWEVTQAQNIHLPKKPESKSLDEQAKEVFAKVDSELKEEMKLSSVKTRRCRQCGGTNMMETSANIGDEGQTLFWVCRDCPNSRSSARA